MKKTNCTCKQRKGCEPKCICSCHEKEAKDEHIYYLLSKRTIRRDKEWGA